MEHFVKNIEITNFKSIRHAEIKDCRRVNIFIGYPNVGKSNILEALSFLSVGVNVHDVDLRKYLRFDKYINLFNENNIDNQIKIKIDKVEALSFKYQKGHFHLRSESQKMFFEMEVPLEGYKLNSMEHTSAASDNYDNLERLQVKKYIFLESDKYYPSDFSRELIAPFGENLSDTIKYNPDLKKEVVDLFRSSNLKYATDESNTIKIIKEYNDQEVKIFPYIQMADTLRRLIFYKAAVISNYAALLLLEEPESHMFPPYISQLTSDIIQDRNENQFFIATHSPFVLNDFMEDLKDDELSIYAVGLENGETTITRLTNEQVTEAYQYGIDLFFNLENYLKLVELVKQ